MRWGDFVVAESRRELCYGTVDNDRLCAALSTNTNTLTQYLTNTPTTPYGTPKGEDQDWDQGYQ